MNSKPSSNISSHNNKDDHSGRPLAFEPVSKDKLIDQEES